MLEKNEKNEGKKEIKKGKQRKKKEHY